MSTNFPKLHCDHVSSLHSCSIWLRLSLGWEICIGSVTFGPLPSRTLTILAFKLDSYKVASFFSPVINSIMNACSINDRSNVTADGSCQLSLPTMQARSSLIPTPVLSFRVLAVFLSSQSLTSYKKLRTNFPSKSNGIVSSQKPGRFFQMAYDQFTKGYKILPQTAITNSFLTIP